MRSAERAFVGLLTERRVPVTVLWGPYLALTLLGILTDALWHIVLTRLKACASPRREEGAQADSLEKAGLESAGLGEARPGGC